MIRFNCAIQFLARLFTAFLTVPYLTACLPNDGAGIAQPDYQGELERALETFQATGLTAAVLVEGDVVFQGSVGTAEEGRDRKITDDMLLPIGSISKAFTTTALAILVDRSAVEWDAPLKRYIPEFEMYDPWVTEHFTVRDALTHRSGLPLGAGDLLFWPDAKSSISDIIAALPSLPQSTDFRSTYAYDNLLYVVAGEVITRVSGKSWHDFLTDEIFNPLGMDDCYTSIARVPADRVVITGHERAPQDAVGTPIDERTQLSETVAAAGGILCPIGDMLTWAKFWLAGGVTQNGKRLITEHQADELWTGVTPLNRSKMSRDSGLSHVAAYALGWSVQDFDGTLMIAHSGGISGVISHLLLLPEKNIAIFAVSNDYRRTSLAWARQIADDLLGTRSFDFIAAYGQMLNDSIENATTALAQVVKPESGNKQPGLPLTEYAGVYRDPWYGDVTVSEKNGALFLDMSRSELLDGTLMHYNGNRFAAIWPDRSLKADAFVDFDISANKVVGIKMKAISEITDFSYDFHHLDLRRVR